MNITGCLSFIFVVLLVISTSHAQSQNAPSQTKGTLSLERKVPAGSAALIFINTKDPKQTLRLAGPNGIALITAVNPSPASVEILKFVRRSWGGSKEGRNAQAFTVRGATAIRDSSKSSASKPQLFRIAGRANAEWILTVGPFLPAGPPLPNHPVEKPSLPGKGEPAPNGGRKPSDVEPISTSVLNGCSRGRGPWGYDCDPFADCRIDDTLDWVPGMHLPVAPANATIISAAGGETAYTICYLL